MTLPTYPPLPWRITGYGPYSVAIVADDRQVVYHVDCEVKVEQDRTDHNLKAARDKSVAAYNETLVLARLFRVAPSLLEAVAPLVALIRKMDGATVEYLRTHQPEEASKYGDAALARIGREDASVMLTSGDMHSPLTVSVGDLRKLSELVSSLEEV